ncbi:MAG: hypothetical protein M1818_000805 [Claussenomyces sp. TS43310]|nr:MAG: hypothetical protein M1818_000805 [Claussenomyces sp. TS43310]
MPLQRAASSLTALIKKQTSRIDPSSYTDSNGSLGSLLTKLDIGKPTPDAPPRILCATSPNAMNSLRTTTSPSKSSISALRKPESNPKLAPNQLDVETIPIPLSNADPAGPLTSNNRLDGSQGTFPLGTASAPRVNTSTQVSSVRMISAEFGPTRTYTNFAIAEDVTLNSDGSLTQPWSSAVGKANLGKSGRVIERLMGENDMLKRDLQIEKLKAEEGRNAVKMAEGKMEALVSEYEGRLHEAAVNKTLLKRRERQLLDAKAQLEAERSRADAAIERERTWRDAMENMEVETKSKVDEATNLALLMEGRYKTLSNHWKEQGAMVDATITTMQQEISVMVQHRQNDVKRMDLLNQICDQQADRLVSLENQKTAITEAHETYKAEQERLLHGIKARARRQEQTNEEALTETNEVLGKLKWALAVKRDVNDIA